MIPQIKNYPLQFLQTETLANGATFTRSYSAAGRETSFADPYFNAGRTYDSTTGLLSSYAIAAGTYSNITHDFEGSIAGYTAYGGQSVAFSYSPLGESLGQLFAPGALDDNNNQTWPDSAPVSMINGYSDPDGVSPFDFRNAVGLGTQRSFTAPNGGSNCSGTTGTQCSWGVTKHFTFDAAGRQTGGTDPWNDTYICGHH